MNQMVFEWIMTCSLWLGIGSISCYNEILFVLLLHFLNWIILMIMLDNVWHFIKVWRSWPYIYKYYNTDQLSQVAIEYTNDPHSHTDLNCLHKHNDTFDQCYQSSQGLYSMINMCIIIIYPIGLYRIVKAIYEIIFSIKFPWWEASSTSTISGEMKKFTCENSSQQHTRVYHLLWECLHGSLSSPSLGQKWKPCMHHAY